MKNCDVKWLHVEASSRCNAWCPACPRNQNGFGLAPDLVEQDLSPQLFTAALDQLPGLVAIQFCGNLGDPLAHHDLMQLIRPAVARGLKIQIHTNGGLRNATWWQELAACLSGVDHDVWFGIDGIGDVHEIYRQGTRYDTVMVNARTFIDHGGNATWQFIPFHHNQHQIKEAMRTSTQMGFKKFKIIKSFRTDRTQARHWRTGEVFELEPADIYRDMVLRPKSGLVRKEDCMHLSMPSIYMNSLGRFSPCCYFNRTRSCDTIQEVLSKYDIAQELEQPPSVCVACCGS